MQARGFGFDQSQETTEPMAGVEASPSMLIPIADPVFVVLGPSLRVALLRPRLFYRDASGSERALYEAPAVALAGRAGLAIRFP
jgi:hypothetical protein